MVRKPFAAIVASVLVAAGGAAAVAAQTGHNDALAVNQAAITLTQAVATAEQHAGGRASRAEFEHSRTHGWVYDVEVVAGEKVFDVEVDAQTAAVLASALDSGDHDDGRDARD